MQKRLRHLLRRLIFLFCVPLAIFYTTTVLFVIQRSGGTGEKTADCAVVFGTAVRPIFNEKGEVIDLTAGPGIMRRVGTAARLFEQGSVHRLFFAGGTGEGNAKSEAEVMKEYAMSLGVPEGRITVEEGSRSTWENILEVRPLTFDCHGVIGISDGYHLARIHLIAHIQSWDLPVIAAEPRAPVLFVARNWLREAIGIDLLVLMQLLT